MMIKLSDETIKALGASNAGDAQAKIDELLKTSAKAKTDADNMASALSTSAESIKALEGRIAAMEKKEFKLSEADRNAIVEAATAKAEETAKREGANAVSQALAKVGVQAVSGGAKTDDNLKTEKVDEKSEDAEAVWNANANIRAEFIEKSAWLAYAKADKAGRVAIKSVKKD